MEENYSYTEYNEEKNRIPWVRVLISFLILVVIVVIILLLLRACGKPSLRNDLIEAAKEYYELYPDQLPSEVGECFVVTLRELEQEGLIKVSDYETCDKDNTYVNVCYLESRTYHYSAILECEAEDTNYGMWQDGTESDIDENSDIRFEFLGEEMNSGTKYYYPNDLTNIDEVKEYYASIPSSGYSGQDDEQTGYKWYTEKTVNSYWNNGAYSSTQPSGYTIKGASTTTTKYTTERPSSASYRDIEEVTLYRSRKVAYPAVYTCSNPNNPDDVIVGENPCSGTHSKVEAIVFTCNGTDRVDVTAEQINNRDFPPCGEWSDWTTKKCTTSFTGGISCQTDEGYKYTDTMWKWYRKDNVRSYYPSGASSASGENTYYISSPTSGAIRDDATAATVHKYYKLEEGTVGEGSVEEWLPVTDGYVALEEMLAAFRELGYEVYSLADVNKLDQIRYQFQMQYRSLEE